MNVLVDTSIWTLALRRRRSGLSAEERVVLLELTDLMRDDRVLMVGPVRQELLSGLKSEAQFDRLRDRLADFADDPLETADFEEAARCHNRCSAAGVAGSRIDFLLCGIALRRGASLFTADKDFELYSQHLPLTLYKIPGSGDATQSQPTAPNA